MAWIFLAVWTERRSRTVIRLKSRSQRIRPRLFLRDLTTIALCAALLIVVKIALAVPILPNIELVSLFVMLFTLTFERRVLPMIYVFVLANGLIYGFDLRWWSAYLYVWTILAGLTWLCRRSEAPLTFATLSGAFGLCFGALCSIPYLFMGGPAAMFGYWVLGIPFDLLHGGANFAICLVLWKPLFALLGQLQKKQTSE